MNSSSITFRPHLERIIRDLFHLFHAVLHGTIIFFCFYFGSLHMCVHRGNISAAAGFEQKTSIGLNKCIPQNFLFENDIGQLFPSFLTLFK